MKVLIIFILIILQAYPTEVVACGNVRLDINGSLCKIPIYDQDSFGSCYAYSAAQLIDAYRFSQMKAVPGTFTSPVHLSTIYAATYDTDALDGPKTWGGEESKAIEAAKRRGVVCRKNVTDMILSGQTEQEFYSKFIKYFRDNYKQENDKNIFENMWEYINSDYTPAVKEAQCNLRSSSLPENLLPSLEALSDYMTSSGMNHANYLVKLLDGICGPAVVDLKGLPNVVSEDTLTENWSPDERSYLSQGMLDKLMAKPTPQPVGIAFCMEAFYPDYKGFKLADTKNAEKFASMCSGHAALVAGSRKNKQGKCEYLIRNSWGSGCSKFEYSGYDILDCEEKTGQFWVSGDRLGMGIYGATTFL